jgi:hypothetical protein
MVVPNSRIRATRGSLTHSSVVLVPPPGLDTLTDDRQRAATGKTQSAGKTGTAIDRLPSPSASEQGPRARDAAGVPYAGRCGSGAQPYRFDGIS